MNDRCVATRQGAINPAIVHQCSRKATHGEWCRQHAESLGGWRLAAPDTARIIRYAGEVVATFRTYPASVAAVHVEALNELEQAINKGTR